MAPCEELREQLLKQKLCVKTVVLEDKLRCSLLFCENSPGRLNLVIAFSSFNGYVYVKAVPENAVPAHLWHCNDVYYTPYGLYTFARSTAELVAKLKAKTGLLEAQSRLARERLEAGGEGV